MKYLVAGVVFLVYGLVGFLAGGLPLPALGILLGILAGVKGVAELRGKQSPISKNLDFSASEALDQERADLLQESYLKAVTDYAELEAAAKSIQDKEVVQQIGKMQEISGNMLQYLEKHPEKLPLAQKFVDYYQDRAVLLTRKYQELEKTGLETSATAEMKAKVKTTLFGFDEAYEEQFEHILQDQFLDLNAELKVVEQTMDADGIKPSVEEVSHAGGRLGDEQLSSMLESARPNQPYPPKKRNVVSKLENGGSVIPKDVWGDVLFTKILQSVLAIFLGSFGAHKFYQGRTAVGVLYCIFFWTAIPGFIGFIEGLRYLVMKMDDFYLDYYLKK